MGLIYQAGFLQTYYPPPLICCHLREAAGWPHAARYRSCSRVCSDSRRTLTGACARHLRGRLSKQDSDGPMVVVDALGGYEGYRPAPRVKRGKKNSMTRRLLRLPDRLVLITKCTIGQNSRYKELDPTELQTKSISERGPAKWPSKDEKNASWRHRKAPRCARR